jgi:hypothetical protein
MYAFWPTSRFSPFYVLYTCGPARGAAFVDGPLKTARWAEQESLAR